MNNQTLKKITNFILVITFTYFYVSYFAPFIYRHTNSRLIIAGVWSVIMGVWGNLVGMRVIKPLLISDDYRKENNFFIILGVVLMIIGFLFTLYNFT